MSTSCKAFGEYTLKKKDNSPITVQFGQIIFHVLLEFHIIQ